MENIWNEFLKTIPANIFEEVYARLQRCTGAAEVMELCKAYQLPITEQIASAAAKFLAQPALISEEDLNTIAGASEAITHGCSPLPSQVCSGGA